MCAAEWGPIIIYGNKTYRNDCNVGEKKSVFIQYKVDTKKATKMGSIIGHRLCNNENPNSTQQAKINLSTSQSA